MEAAEVLYRTNTFSFGDCTTFKVFMASLHAVHRCKITKLHFGVLWRWGQHGIRGYWIGAIGTRVVPSLNSLQSIEFSLEMREPKMCWLYRDDHAFLVSRLSAFLRFQQLPLRSARVIISDDTNRIPGRSLIREDQRRLTWVEKRNIALFYECCLLKGPEPHAILWHFTLSRYLESQGRRLRRDRQESDAQRVIEGSTGS